MLKVLTEDNHQDVNSNTYDKSNMKEQLEVTRLALGTAQFGLNYGIANERGRVSTDQVSEILKAASSAGIDTLDTAIAYGDSEQRLGDVGISCWKVVSKLPEMPLDTVNVYPWVKQSVCTSLERLQVSQLYGLLLHRPGQLLGSQGDALYHSLSLMKEQGLVKKIGVSIYSPSELNLLYSKKFSFDLVQSPLNVLDRSLEKSGWLHKLRDLGVEIHTRSVFLQGLLLMNPSKRPTYFKRWQPLWDHWDQWLTDAKLTPLQACLSYVRSLPEVSRIVVGVDSLSQLEEILDSPISNLEIPDSIIASNDPELIYPFHWMK